MAEEVINLKGYVRAYTTPFSRPSSIIVATKRGDVTIPVKNCSDYPLNQSVSLVITINEEGSDE